MDNTCDKLSDKQRTALDNVNSDNTLGLAMKSEFTDKSNLLATKAFEIAEHASLQSAKDAFESVLSLAGASYKRDAIDTRIVEETRKGTYTHEGTNGGTLGMIDKPSDVEGWPNYANGTAAVDADGDGIPDEWEKKHGLNPNDKSDGAKYNLSPSYTNLEVYLNSLVEGLFPTK